MLGLNRNLPGGERILRVCLAAACTAAALHFLPPGPGRLLAVAAAAGLAVTAFLGFCPACALHGRRSIERAPR